MKRFCWCLSLRVGCLIISVLTLLLGFLHLVEFFRLKEYHDPTQASVWPKLLWGILHLMASMCLSISVLSRAVIPILGYTFIEIFFLMYVIIYTSVSCALKTNIYANLGLPYSISYWIIVVLACGEIVLTTYFLNTAISFYLLKRQQRKDREL